MQMSVTIGELATALAAAQAIMEQPNKDREVEVQMRNKDGTPGGKYKFRYATLDNIIATSVRPSFAPNGLSFGQSERDGRIVTRIMHKSGEWMDFELPLPPLPQKPQEAGAAISYFKRYSLCAALGIVADEDDEKNVAIEHDAAPAPAFPEGPYQSKSAIKAAWKALVRDLHSAGSAQEVEEFIDRDKDMLAQFRHAARLNIDDLRAHYQGHGDFIGVAAELARARDRFVCVADAPRDPGPPAAIAEVEMAETTKVLLALIARSASIKDVDAVIADNLELINAASDEDKQALREASTNAKAAIRAARNHPVNAG